MLAEIFEFGRDFFAIMFTGITIKLTDDYLDQAIDQKVSYFSLAASLKEGILPYCILLFSISVGLNKDLSLALFFSSYIIGMFGDMNRPLSFGLNGYQESIIVFITSVLLIGWQLTTISLLLIIAIQIIDDYFDLQEDRVKGSNNLVFRFGKVESRIVTMAFIVTACYLNLYYSIIILTVYFIINRFSFGKKGDSKNI